MKKEAGGLGRQGGVSGGWCEGDSLRELLVSFAWEVGIR